MAVVQKPGDVVQLKSGGPPMTVGKSAGPGAFLCYWFVGPEESREIRCQELPAEVLEPADKPSPTAPTAF